MLTLKHNKYHHPYKKTVPCSATLFPLLLDSRFFMERFVILRSSPRKLWSLSERGFCVLRVTTFISGQNTTINTFRPKVVTRTAKAVMTSPSAMIAFWNSRTAWVAKYVTTPPRSHKLQTCRTKHTLLH